MSQDRIDASIGLALSLKLFQHYQRSGVLQAEVHHVPGVQGRCIATIHLKDGMVVSCYVENKYGQRHQSSSEILCRLDSERGPFEWSFQPLVSPPVPPASATQPASGTLPASQLMDNRIPVIVAPLRWERLSNWTLEQKQMLYEVLQLIDGRRTIQEIKANVLLSAQIVDEAIEVLLTLRIIVLPS